MTTPDQISDESAWTSPRSADDVTDEMVALAVSVIEGRYDTGRIEWDDVWDRMDGFELADGTLLDLGDSLTSPALLELKQRVRSARSQ